MEATMPEVLLKGCGPVPLAAYLKTLGIFRLVAEQKDENVRGFWRDEAFVLDTALAEEELARFFLDKYHPSPIISPWNGGSGFYYQEGKTNEKDPGTGKKIKTGIRDQRTEATRAVDLIAEAKADRFQPLQTIIDQVRRTLKELGYQQAPTDEQKQNLVTRLRRSLPDEGLQWLDAALALSTDNLDKPPLLGTGGNDGNLDFSSNYMHRLLELFDLSDGQALTGAEGALRTALFGTSSASLRKGAVGQFAPGAAGGPNAAVGFERETLINPWDYVLMLEGALLFSASVSRRLRSANSSGLSYPFTVNSTNTDGAGSALIDEKRKSKGKVVGNSYEIWMPLWDRPASFQEIGSLLSEGRATVGRRPVRDGLDFSRAVASFGINRGISAFQRYAFLQRRGDSISATPKGRFGVQPRPKARLLNDLEAGDWLSRFRQYARRPDRQNRGFEAPRRLQALTLRLDEAIFTMTQDTTHRTVQRVLIAVGDAAAYLASSRKARDPKEGRQGPPPRISRDWFHAANDGTAEFRIAAALAGLGRAAQTAGEAEKEEYAGEREGESAAEAAGEMEAEAADPAAAITEEERARKIPPPPFRTHLAPLDEKSWYGRYRAWSDQDRLAVWGAGAFERNLIAVLERRLLFATQRNLVGGPFDGRVPADLASVLAFLAGETDDAKIGALAQGLAWAEPPNFIRTAPVEPRPLPLAYALIKPFFAPVEALRELGALREGAGLPIPPGLVPRLHAGDVGDAVALACRRAQGSGLPVTFEPVAEHVASIDGPHLLAGLLIPIRAMDVKRVLQRAYPALFDEAETPKTKEDPADAA
jgi:CRISPR-associated protein Csx17